MSKHDWRDDPFQAGGEDPGWRDGEGIWAIAMLIGPFLVIALLQMLAR